MKNRCDYYSRCNNDEQGPVLRRSTSTANWAELSSCNRLSSSDRLLLNAAELCTAAAAGVLCNRGCERVMSLPTDAGGHFIF